MKVAALCAGYGGLEMGLAMAGIDVDLAWYAETDLHASKVMAHHHPTVPNLGDLTTITDPPPVDIVTAGFPCQPVSAAGQRKGIHDDRWLIDDVVGLTRRTGARWLILENVSGLYSANDGEAFARVVDALTEGGFDAEWAPLRASDIGAPHRRTRWFCVARAADTEHVGRAKRAGLGPSEPTGIRRNGPDDNNRTAPMTLLPTPTANQPGGTAEQHLQRKRGGKMNRTNPTVTDLGMAVTLLPTPTTQDAANNGGPAQQRRNTPPLNTLVTTTDWVAYAPAIRRWETILGRPAPAPLDTKGRLSPALVEWMMGLPEGWVTQVPELTRAQQLGRLGNGVVPQQAAHAITQLLDRHTE